MVILGALMVTPIYFLNTINDAAALLLARGTDFLSVFDKPQRDALVMVFLRMHGQGILANEVFWGLWLFPFGLLVYRSRFLPRILGVWLMLNCFAYLATSVTGILWPQYEQRVSNWVFPVMFSELAIMLWLIIMGCQGAAAPCDRRLILRGLALILNQKSSALDRSPDTWQTGSYVACPRTATYCRVGFHSGKSLAKGANCCSYMNRAEAKALSTDHGDHGLGFRYGGELA